MLPVFVRQVLIRICSCHAAPYRIFIMAVFFLHATVAEFVHGSDQSYLQLKDGSAGLGRVVGFTDDQHLVWQNEGFMKAFEFPIHEVQSIMPAAVFGQDKRQQSDLEMPKSEGMSPLRLQVKGEMQLVGVPIDLTPDYLQLKTRSLGTLTIDRSKALRISRTSLSDLGLNPLSEKQEWNSTELSSEWEITNQGCSTRVRGAALTTPLSQLEHQDLYLRIRWEETANFLIGLGAQHHAKTKIAGRAIQIDGDRVARPGNPITHILAIEAWAGKLFLVQENGKSMETASLGDYGDQSGTLELIISPETTFKPTVVQVVGGPCIELKSKGGDKGSQLAEMAVRNQGKFFSIDRIGVRMSGSLPGSDNDTKLPSLLIDQEVEASGGIRSWDFETGKLEIEQSGRKELRSVPQEKLISARVLLASDRLPAQSASSNQPSPNPHQSQGSSLSAPDAIGEFRISLDDGSRIRATIQFIQDGRLTVTIPGITETVFIDSDSIIELFPIGASSESQSTPSEQASSHAGMPIDGSADSVQVQDSTDGKEVQSIFFGTAYVECSQLKGTLAESDTDSSPISLFWKPDLSRTGAEIDSESDVDLRSSAIIVERVDEARQSGSTIELTTGDEITVTVTHIDENNLYFRAASPAQECLSTRWVQSVRFRDSVARPTMTQEQKQRLLTVPRAQLHDPPRHLLISTSGDVLRGSLTSLSESLVTADIGGRVVQLPLSQIHEIVWLHWRSWETRADEKARFIQIAMEGNKTTMLDAIRVEQGSIVGKSQMFGEVRMQLDRLKRISTGATIKAGQYQLTSEPMTK